jgi:hypothetical protein
MGFIVKPAPRDEQRKRLYTAERQVKALLRDTLPTIGEMQGFVDSILRSRWLQTYFAASVVAPIRVIGGRQRPATAMNFLSTISYQRRFLQPLAAFVKKLFPGLPSRSGSMPRGIIQPVELTLADERQAIVADLARRGIDPGPVERAERYGTLNLCFEADRTFRQGIPG